MSEKGSIPAGYLLARNVNHVRREAVRVAKMPKYSEPAVTTCEANTLPWEEFKDKMQPFSLISSRDGITEFAFTQKSTPWSIEDVNMWVGSSRIPIDEITDFSTVALADLFTIHSEIAKQFAREGRTLQWGFGYNPEDFSPGHHSVKRFHTHIRGLGNPLDQRNVVTTPWKDSTWYDRLTSIEPFTPIAADILASLLQKPEIGQVLGWTMPTIHPSGYIEYQTQAIADADSYAKAFRQLYEDGRASYETVRNIFTDGQIDPDSDKYIPLPTQERGDRFEQFVGNNNIEFSPESLRLLKYLAHNVQPASTRLVNGTAHITNAAKVHITRGFAGGFMFTTHPEGRMTADFFPRIITTTGPTKNLYADGDFYGFTKTQDKPTQMMREQNAAYARKIASIVSTIAL